MLKRPDAHEASASVDRASGVGFASFPRGLGDAAASPTCILQSLLEKVEYSGGDGGRACVLCSPQENFVCVVAFPLAISHLFTCLLR